MSVINITEAAVKELKTVWADQNLTDDAVLTLGVRGGGCAGYQYVLNIQELNKIDAAKYTIEEIDGLKVAVDHRSAMYIQGTIVDYHSDLTKRGFVFTNPNSKSTCGCGSSFSA